MIYSGIISHLIEFLLCVLYGVVVLTVIPECTEAIVFHFRIVTDAYVSTREQIRSLKLVVVYAFLIIVIVGITIIRCGVRVEPYLLCQRETALCRKCRRKECEKKYERDYHVRNRIGCTDFVGDCFLLRNQNCVETIVKLWKRNLKTLNSPLSPQNLRPKSERHKVNQKQVKL